jgi:type III secretion system (T3SS) SseB-like protein
MSNIPSVGPLRMRLEFLGEQDGPPERELKEALVRLFEAKGKVNRAYLARLSYLETGATGVGLCVPVDAYSVELVRAVGSVFSDLFGADQYLDVVFVTEDEEKRLRDVCRPFFKKPAPN